MDYIVTEKTWASFNIDTDFWEDSYFDKPRNKKLILWPGIVSADTIAQVRYTKIPEPMSADDDEPLIPYENRRILVIGPLEEHFITARDQIVKAMWEKESKQLLKEMESDVETTDDELVLQVDRRSNRRRGSGPYFHDDELVSD